MIQNNEQSRYNTNYYLLLSEQNGTGKKNQRRDLEKQSVMQRAKKMVLKIRHIACTPQLVLRYTRRLSVYVCVCACLLFFTFANVFFIGNNCCQCQLDKTINQFNVSSCCLTVFTFSVPVLWPNGFWFNFNTKSEFSFKNSFNEHYRKFQSVW